MNAVQEWSRLRKYRQFEVLLDPRPSDVVMVFGAGEGTDLIFEYLTGFVKEIWACDWSAKKLAVLSRKYPSVKTVVLNLNTPLPFKDDTFGIGYSNALLEHLEHPEVFMSELRRTCTYWYVTCPNFWFPFDLHSRLPFYHWLPQRVQQAVVRVLRPGHYREGYWEYLKPPTRAELSRWASPNPAYHLDLYNLCAYTPRLSLQEELSEV